MKRITVLLVGAGMLLAAAVVIGGHVAGPPPVAAPIAIATATAEIVRGPLRDTRSLKGTLGYGDLTELRPALGATTVMLTWIAPVGAIIARGEPLYRLDGQPAILFYGDTPQHRTLRFAPGAKAPVWVELEQAERAEEAAQLALDLEQARLDDAEASLADLALRLDDALLLVPASAEFAQLTGAVVAAEAKLSRVRDLAAAQLTPAVEIGVAEATLATARAALDAGLRLLRKDLAAARIATATARIALADATARLDDARTAHATLAARAMGDADITQIAANLAALGYAGALPDQVLAWQRAVGLPTTGIIGPEHLVVVPGPIHIAEHDASAGERLAAVAEAVLRYSSIDKSVTVPLAIADQRLAAPGSSVQITLPDGTVIDAIIARIGSIVTDGNIDITLSIADQAALAGLEVAAVDVEFVSDSRDDVLSVPIIAMLARPEGGFAVEIVSATGRSLVPVSTGLFAAGRVEISGDGIAAGVRVSVPG